MKSLAMVSYWFPPEGAAGVYRSLRFVRHLPSHGWQPVVIADDPRCYVRYDPGLLDLVPSNTEIIRVRNPDPWNALNAVLSALESEPPPHQKRKGRRRCRRIDVFATRWSRRPEKDR